MVLEKTFQELSTELRKLRDCLEESRLTIVEDRPVKGDAALADNFENGIDDVLGWLGEAIQVADEALRALGPPVDRDRALRSLTNCQEQFSRSEKQFLSDLLSYEKLDQLNRMGREWGGHWKVWSDAVRQSLDRCREPLEAVKKALAACWGEIAERAPASHAGRQEANMGELEDKLKKLQQELEREKKHSDELERKLNSKNKKIQVATRQLEKLQSELRKRNRELGKLTRARAPQGPKNILDFEVPLEEGTHAEIRVYDLAGTTLIQTQKPDESGKARFQMKKPGRYLAKYVVNGVEREQVELQTD